MSCRTYLIRVGVGALLTLAGCSELDSDVRVEYVIEGTANRVLVTYRLPSGGEDQRVVGLPFGFDSDFQEGVFVGIAAQSLDEESRELSCELRVEGETVDTESQTGVEATVTCTATAQQ